VKVLGERGFRDRDFLSTREGFLFCVVGPYHPVNRVISYLKYSPDSKGKWQKGKDRFKRVMRTYTIPNLLETFDLLKNTYPQYLFFSSTYNITMTAIPQTHIVKHFKPDEKLAELFKNSRLDSLQRKVVRFVSLLSKLSLVPADNFGVTGSILLDIHNPAFSDMDITVCGMENSYAVKKALTQVHLTSNSGVKRFEGEKLRKWYINKTRNHPISLAEAERIYERKWNIGIFDGTMFSVHPIKLEKELMEKYGDKTYHPAGMVTMRAVVSDYENSIFLPAVYGVREVEVEGDVEAHVEEVVSYEGLYDSLAEKGETIEVKGKLEHVVDNRTSRKYDRVLVGSPEGKGREYIKPV
jgi:predicted nucleotidyltransferase